MVQNTNFSERLQPGRNWNSDQYRFGFNGKENDNEVIGIGNSVDFGARIYDPRLGRWLSVDPLQAKYPDLSPYNFCANNPVFLIDPDGLRIDRVNSKGLGKIRRALKTNAIGRETWKLMKKSPSLITLIASDAVVVVNNGPTWMSPVEGLQLPTGRVVNNGVQNNSPNGGTVPQNKDQLYYSSQTIYISLGTVKMKQSIEAFYGTTWENLTPTQKNEGVQRELNTGNYTVYDPNIDTDRNTIESTVPASSYSNIAVAAGSPWPIQGIPMDETEEESINRITVHEGKGHVVFGLFTDFLVGRNRGGVNQEQKSREFEQDAVNQNNAKR